ncbi:GNAT family N-acetyltransferase [Streptomyces sp. SID3212]|uniref:GNAT family N-acetyltransferase n=1 Tax=Streptomyces sp. SID3212 TaxID=2690259 RepID=UPI00136FF436|nr:GNAT family N-acetyltransferase [Streptomyces sp. SID3212]
MAHDVVSQDAADAAARAWMAALAMFASAQPNGSSRIGAHGTAELVTGAPMPLLNGVIGIAREADPEEIAAFAASTVLEAVPWSVQVRGERVDDRIVAVAAGHGLERRSTLPFMLASLGMRTSLGEAEGRSERGSTADGPTVRSVSSDEAGLYRAALAAGYGGPEEIFSVFVARPVLDHVAMRAYVAEVAGVVVATSFGVLVDDFVGVFNIAVPPEYRRRGYGRVATEAVLRDAYEEGARTAFLHASPPGVPLYRAMGFQLAENWSLFTP